MIKVGKILGIRRFLGDFFDFFAFVDFFVGDFGSSSEHSEQLGFFGGGCPKTYWDIKQIALVNFYFFYYSCLTLYIIETQLFCLYL